MPNKLRVCRFRSFSARKNGAVSAFVPDNVAIAETGFAPQETARRVKVCAAFSGRKKTMPSGKKRFASVGQQKGKNPGLTGGKSSEDRQKRFEKKKKYDMINKIAICNRETLWQTRKKYKPNAASYWKTSG